MACQGRLVWQPRCATQETWIQRPCIGASLACGWGWAAVSMSGQGKKRAPAGWSTADRMVAGFYQEPTLAADVSLQRLLGAVLRGGEPCLR